MELAWIFWPVGVLATVAIAVALIALWCYRLAFYNPQKNKHLDPHTFFGNAESEFCRAPMTALVDELLSAPCERVTITSRDGLRLCGRLYRFSEENKVEILMHGWRSSAVRDSSGGARIARAVGYNLLIVDQRAHGESEGRTITFGIRERYDCVDWVHFLVARFGEDVKILLGGVSMGAATVLMAAGLDELPRQVVAVTADCPYSSPEQILRKVCRDRGIPDRIGYPFLYLGARLYGGFSLKDGSPVDAVRVAKVPIMLMHGEGDSFVPFEMSKDIQAAATTSCTLLPIPKAGHGLAYFYNTPLYSHEVGSFKQTALR